VAATQQNAPGTNNEPVNGLWGANAAVALNAGPSGANTGDRYIGGTFCQNPVLNTTTLNRGFGPSSDHTGLVLHLFGDGHVTGVSINADANTYLQFTSRNSGEPGDDSKL
jgi:hypothetical protein